MPHANLIDRYLVAIEALNLQPLLILNKCDLLSSSEDPEAVVELVELYRSLSYPCLTVSALQGEGLEALREQLQGRTTVLVGQSGVGKSSLVNGLGGELENDSPLAQVGELSEFHDKGMHTTTTSVLFHLGRLRSDRLPRNQRVRARACQPPGGARRFCRAAGNCSAV